jgi:bifunctional pyridoxal-dependent enzyme with beta-cystathionase and maltose regulon repressor activities
VPSARHHLVEAGYLARVDFRSLELGLTRQPPCWPAPRWPCSSKAFALNGGGQGYARLNFAIWKDILCEIITRISHATEEKRNPR